VMRSTLTASSFVLATCRMILIVSAICVYVSAVPVPAYQMWMKAKHGSFWTAKESKTVHGYRCGGPASAIVYHPRVASEKKKFPLIAFAHGFYAGGSQVPVDYGPKLLSAVAAWGFIVIAAKDAPHAYCEKQSLDLLTSIEAMREDQRVDWNKPVGLLGHSMGGHAALKASANANLAKYKIGAAVALHPMPHAVFPQPRVPVFFGTGTADMVVPPASTEKMYYETKYPIKVLANMVGANHGEATTNGPNRWSDYASAFFGCHLYRAAGACDTIYGRKWWKCDLCTCRAIPMKVCKHEPSWYRPGTVPGQAGTTAQSTGSLGTLQASVGSLVPESNEIPL